MEDFFKYLSNEVDFSDEASNISSRKLIKIVDLLGRETKEKKNGPLFYIYDDGTVEKKIVLE